MTHYDRYFALLSGGRELATFEHSKEPDAFNSMREILRQRDTANMSGIVWKCFDAVDEQGEPTTLLAVATSLYPLRLLEMLLRRREEISRFHFQESVGRLLGYTEREIQDFIGSETSKECPCTLCGRNELDAAAAAARGCA